MASEDIGDLVMVMWQRWRSASPVRKGAITREQYWVLRLLMERGSMKVKDLALAIGCTPGSASVAVKRLEKSGLVRRDRSARDERVVTVILEKEGVKRLSAWRDNQVASMNQLFDSLSPEERKSLRLLLQKALSANGELTSPLSAPG